METAIDTPTETMVRANIDKATATDARGRLIAVRKLSALQYFNLVKVMGPDASNGAALDLAMIASSVCRIDIMDIAFPRKDSDVNFLIQTLDFDGLAAASEALKKLAADNAAAGTDVAKN
jgi:hypothetical protein